MGLSLTISDQVRSSQGLNASNLHWSKEYRIAHKTRESMAYRKPGIH